MLKALFVELEAKPGSEEEVAAFLKNALDVAESEPDTRDWYALRFSPDAFAIFDTFDGNLGRLKHLAGQISRGLALKSFSSLNGVPDFTSSEILVAKLPTGDARATKALYVPIETKLGQGRDFGEIMVSVQSVLDAERGTIAWYGLRMGPNHFALVALFVDEDARNVHMRGPVATGLQQAVGRFLDRFPEVRLGDVLASKHSGWEQVASAAKQMHPEQSVRISPETA